MSLPVERATRAAYARKVIEADNNWPAFDKAPLAWRQRMEAEVRAVADDLLHVEELARTLFVIDSDQPKAFAMRIWDEARADSPVKRMFRLHAMKFRQMTLEGS